MADVTVEISQRGGAPVAPMWTCRKCGTQTERAIFRANLSVCPSCGYHARIGARERIALLADPGSFQERWVNLRTLDPLSFVDLEDYPERVREAQAKSGLSEAIVVGTASIDGFPCWLAVMDFSFMGGSMGSVVGEKLWRAAEAAAQARLPLVAVCSSGGARMQEGILSLMQMAKTSCAVDLLNEARSPFISVLVDPCTGGVVASFATLADICVAEPGALLTFTGIRVIAETTKDELPEGFGSAERNLELGHLDAVVPRAELRLRLAAYLRLLEGGDRDRDTGSDATGLARGATELADRAADLADRAAGLADRAVGDIRRRGGRARELVAKAFRRA
jgi:acetyl-CoA carboxylase carboxyl transferase subunit beta